MYLAPALALAFDQRLLHLHTVVGNEDGELTATPCVSVPTKGNILISSFFFRMNESKPKPTILADKTPDLSRNKTPNPARIKIYAAFSITDCPELVGRYALYHYLE